MNSRKAYPGTQAVLRAVRLLKALGLRRGRAHARRPGAGRRAQQDHGLPAADGARVRGPRRARRRRRLPSRAGAAGPGRPRARGRRTCARRRAGSSRRSRGRRARRRTSRCASGAETLILDEVMGSHRVGTTPSVGTRWPAHATSTGKVLLAALGAADLEALLASPLPALTPRTITGQAALRRELRGCASAATPPASRSSSRASWPSPCRCAPATDRWSRRSAIGGPRVPPRPRAARGHREDAAAPRGAHLGAAGSGTDFPVSTKAREERR